MTFLLANWKIVLVAAIVFGLAAWGALMRSQRDAVMVEYSDFRRDVAKAAQSAAEQALKTTIENEEKREKADVENLRLQRDLAAATRKLRDARPSSGLLPAAASCPASPEGADRYRAEHQRAYRDLVDGLRAEADRGSKAVVDLNGAKRWAAGLQ